MGTISFLPGNRPGRQPRQPSRRQLEPLGGPDEGAPGPELLPGHPAFLGAWFERLGGESAAPGHRGRYAVVRRGATELGVVAVDADLGIWFTALAGCNPAEDCQHVRRLQRDLSALGFRYSEHATLASQYFGLVLAAFQAAAAARLGPPQITPPLAGLAEPMGADREDGRQPRDGGAPGAAAVGRGEEVA